MAKFPQFCNQKLHGKAAFHIPTYAWQYNKFPYQSIHEIYRGADCEDAMA